VLWEERCALIPAGIYGRWEGIPRTQSIPRHALPSRRVPGQGKAGA